MKYTKYNVNQDFFESIDSEEKAYWLGFIVGDGYIPLKGGLEIQLQPQDKFHLEKFKHSIESNHPIYFCKNNSYKLCLKRVKISEDLNKLGVFNNKSKTIKCPEIEERFQRHFWRGVIDADGSFFVLSRKDRKLGVLQVSLVGSEFIVNSFKDFCLKSTNTKAEGIYEGKGCFCYKISSNKNSLDLLEILYGNASIALERKFNKAKELIYVMGTR